MKKRGLWTALRGRGGALKDPGAGGLGPGEKTRCRRTDRRPHLSRPQTAGELHGAGSLFVTTRGVRGLGGPRDSVRPTGHPLKGSERVIPTDTKRGFHFHGRPHFLSSLFSPSGPSFLWVLPPQGRRDRVM